DPRCDVEPVPIDRHGNDLRAGKRKDTLREPVAGILEPDSIAWIEQGQRGDRERLLRAAHDQDLLRFAAHGSRAAQVARERLAQTLSAGRVSVLRGDRAERAPVTRDETRPDVHGKVIERRLSDAERALADDPRRTVDGGIDAASLR